MNRPETLFLPRDSAPALSLLCHGPGLTGHTPGVLSTARSRHTRSHRAVPSPPCRGPTRRLAPAPRGGLPGRPKARWLWHRLLQHLRPLPHRHRPSRFLWAWAGPGPGRDACGFRPPIPLSGPPPSGRCPPGSARRPRPTPRSQPCTPHTGFATPGGRAECVYPLRGKQNRRAYEYGDAVAPRRQGAGSGT